MVAPEIKKAKAFFKNKKLVKKLNEYRKKNNGSMVGFKLANGSSILKAENKLRRRIRRKNSNKDIGNIVAKYTLIFCIIFLIYYFYFL